MAKFKVNSILLLISISTLVLAQGRGKGNGQGRGGNFNQNLTPEQKAERQAQNLTRKLGLSAEQTSKVQAIALDKIRKGEEIKQQRQSKQIDGRTAAERRMALAQERDNEINAILNPEQQAKLKELREQQKQKAQQRMQQRKQGNNGKGKGRNPQQGNTNSIAPEEVDLLEIDNHDND